MRYRRKPVEVQAIQWDGTQESADLIALIAADSFEILDTQWNNDPDATAICRSAWQSKNWVPMCTGDYVILDNEGYLFPLHQALFHDTYEVIVNR